MALVVNLRTFTAKQLKEDPMFSIEEVLRNLEKSKGLLKSTLVYLDTKEEMCPTCSLPHKINFVEARSAKKIESMITTINSLLEDLKL
jgi:hypothetical protein